MKSASSIYNLGKSKAINSTETSDIVILANTATYAKLSSGVLSQLPSAQLFNMEVNNSNIHIAGFKYTIPYQAGGENITISVIEEEYVPETQLIVFDKNALVNHFQIEKTATQSYANNLVEQTTAHLWGLAGLLKWGKGFIYNNVNMTKIPTGLAE